MHRLDKYMHMQLSNNTCQILFQIFFLIGLYFDCSNFFERNKPLKVVLEIIFYCDFETVQTHQGV